MRTIEIQLLKFEELSEEGKKAALNNLHDINVDHDWWSFTYEDAKTVGIKLTGFNIPERKCTGEFEKDAEEVFSLILENHGETCNTVPIAIHFNAYKANILDDAPVDEDGNWEDESALDELLDENEKDFLQSMRIRLQNDRGSRD